MPSTLLYHYKLIFFGIWRFCFLTFYRYSLSVDGQLLKEKGTAFKYSLKCHNFELNNANFKKKMTSQAFSLKNLTLHWL